MMDRTHSEVFMESMVMTELKVFKMHEASKKSSDVPFLEKFTARPKIFRLKPDIGAASNQRWYYGCAIIRWKLPTVL